MYLKDMQAHSHHSCILSRHVKGYKNLQCAADRNKKSGANIGSTSGITIAVQGKGLHLFLCHRLWLFYSSSRLSFTQII